MAPEHADAQSVEDQVKKKFVTWLEIDQLIENLTQQIMKSPLNIQGVYGVPRGGLIPAVILSHKLGLPLCGSLSDTRVLLVDDVSDTGKTLQFPKKQGFHIATLFIKPQTKTMPDFYAASVENDVWIVYPWETT